MPVPQHRNRYADRPPRIQPELPQATIQIPTPPEESQRGFSIRQALLPLITILGYVLVSFAGQGRNLLFIVPMALSVIISTLFMFITYREERRRVLLKRKEYDLLLAEMRRDMVAMHDRQRNYYDFNYPEPKITLNIDGSHRDTRSGSRLWERRTEDKDFGMVRLGVGARPSTVIFAVERGSNEEEQQMRDAIKLDQDSRIVYDVPITIPLYRPLLVDKQLETQPVRHAIGISGNQTDVYPFIRSLVTHLTTFHSPAELNMHVVGVNGATSQWDWIYDSSDMSSQRSRDDQNQRTVKPLIPHFVMPKAEQDGLVFPVCFEAPEGKAVLRENDRIAQFWKQMRNELDRRAYRLREDRDRGFNNTPLLIIIVDMLDPFHPQSPNAWLEKSMLKDVEAEAAVGELIGNGQNLGVAVIFLVPDRQKVPSGCSAVIEVGAKTQKGTRAFRYAEVGVNTPRYLGNADVIESPQILQDYAGKLHQWSIRQTYGEGIPESVTLLDINSVRSIEELKLGEVWLKTRFAARKVGDNPSQQDADWMRAAIGFMANQEIRRLYFKSDADGVHGMIAGATGSGKSELLMSLILQLACNYDPTVINFVLIDYKGGGAFVPLKNLPHVVDIVTNLQQSAVDRMFKAITAELNRRQEINTATDSKHIVDYRKKGLHLLAPDVFEQRFGIKKQPYPHLFVIIDEFAEMMEGDNDYKEQLNRITRLGRSLGVSLILAAQRPTGVTDQMRSNIQLRICLRVATPAESSELLRRPDAAFLPNGIPGRGYIQVGHESLELTQMAWSGAPYREVRQTPDMQDTIFWNQYQGRDVIWMDRIDAEHEPRALFEVLSDYMRALALQQSEPQRKPWPNTLPTYLALGDRVPENAEYLVEPDRLMLQNMSQNLARLRSQESETVDDAPLNVGLAMQPAITHWLTYTPVEGKKPYMWNGIDWRSEAMRPVIGLIDDATNAKQRLLFARLQQGNLAIFGAPGWGKTSLLRTAIISLAATHSPSELHIYILDYGSQALAVLEGLPHVGAVIAPDEMERIERLLRKLDDLIETRVRLFRERSINNLYNYNLSNTNAILPAVLVVVDNFAEVKENMDQLFGAFLSLAREGGRVGVHLIATGESTASFGKLYNLFTERVSLKLADATEYISIVGRGVRHIDEIPGRGFVAVDRVPLEFQICVPVAPTAQDRNQQRDETNVLRDFVAKMHTAWQSSGMSDDLLPERVDNLPAFVTFGERLDYMDYMEETALPKDPSGLIGVDDATLTNVWIEFRRVPHFLIAGQPQSGKTNALRSLIISLALHYSPEKVAMVFVDRLGYLPYYGGLRSLRQLPHVIDAVSTPEEMKQTMRHLHYEYEEMPLEAGSNPRELFVFIDNYDDFEELEVRPADLGEFTRYMPDRPRIHFIVAGSDIKLRSQDDFTRRISRNGLAMENKTAQAQPFNSSLKKNLRDAELPLGRGFVIRSGQASMLQIVSLGGASEPLDKALDRYIFLVKKHFDPMKAEWVPIPENIDAQNDKPKYTPEQMTWIRTNLAARLGIGIYSLQGIVEDDILRDAANEGILDNVPTPEELSSGSNGALPGDSRKNPGEQLS